MQTASRFLSAELLQLLLSRTGQAGCAEPSRGTADMVTSRRGFRKLISSLLIALPIFGGRLAAQGAGSVQGTIIGAAQQPLEGATVAIVGGRGAARTSAAGRYMLAGVPAGTYTLRAQSIGY